jgi:large subunit ribosomal protein L24
MRLRANDPVIVTKGRDRGKRGRISRVDLKHGAAVVEGVNVVSRHQKPTGNFRQGGIIEKEMPIPVSNLSYYDEESDAPTRIGYRFLADGSKARVSKKSGEVIE